MRKKLALLLALAMLMSTVPAGVFAQTPGHNWFGSGGPNTTPPAITTPASVEVDFEYLDFDDRVVRVGLPTTLSVGVVWEAVGAGFLEIQYDWLRDGEVWEGEGGSGVLFDSDGSRARSGAFISYGQVPLSLLLEEELTHAERGGEWSLRITVVNEGERPLLEKETSVVTVTILDLPTEGGVTFTYPSFDTRTVNLDATTSFRVYAHFTQDAIDMDFYGLQYEWLRDGEVWDRLGGSGTILVGDISDPVYASFSLQLAGGLTHEERAANGHCS
jgi:hypothetical protein